MTQLETVEGSFAPSAGASSRRWETIGWAFMRVSGLALILLALGHFIIQHVINDVHHLSIDFVARRWAMLGWRIYDGLLLLLAVAHGLNGLRVVLGDYIEDPRRRHLVQGTVLVGAGLITVIGIVALVGGVRGPLP